MSGKNYVTGSWSELDTLGKVLRVVERGCAFVFLAAVLALVGSLRCSVAA